MKNLLFPYNTIEETLSIDVNKASVQVIDRISIYPEIPIPIDVQAKVINLCEPMEAKWSVLKLEVLISGARESLEPFFQSENPISAIAVATCKQSNLRKPFVLHRSPTNPYAWEGIVEINRREVAGVAKITGYLTGKAAGRDCRYFAETAVWTVYLDSSYLPEINGAIPVRWLDFASDRNYGDYHKLANEPYYINLELDTPELYLNKGFEGLPELFSEQSRPTGSRLAVHETFRSAVAKSVWLSLFQASLNGIIIGNEDEEPSMPPVEWQQNVLNQILPKIFPGYSIEAALKKVVEDMCAGDLAYVELSASAVIGKDMIREGKAVRTALQNLE